MRKQSKPKDELFSHSSQVAVVKHLQQRLVGEGLGIGAIVEWTQSDSLSAKITNSKLEANIEYRLPSQLSEISKTVIYLEFRALMNKFIKNQTEDDVS